MEDVNHDNTTRKSNNKFAIQNTTSQQMGNGTQFDSTFPDKNNTTPVTSSFIQEDIPPNKPEPVIVVILAYMHTGSSYTASIIQQHPGTFYEFEPLRSLQESSRRNFPIIFLNGTCR